MLNVASGNRSEETAAQFGRFGKIALYHPSAHPAHVVLFVSGDGGWNLGVVDIARELASLDTLVVGIDITFYLKQLEQSFLFTTIYRPGTQDIPWRCGCLLQIAN